MDVSAAGKSRAKLPALSYRTRSCFKYGWEFLTMRVPGVVALWRRGSGPLSKARQER
jgi:hypothetical protein